MSGWFVNEAENGNGRRSGAVNALWKGVDNKIFTLKQ